MCGGGCGKWRSPAGRGGGLESYSRFACIGAPGGAGGACALLPLLLTDPMVALPGHTRLQSLKVRPCEWDLVATSNDTVQAGSLARAEAGMIPFCCRTTLQVPAWCHGCRSGAAGRTARPKPGSNRPSGRLQDGHTTASAWAEARWREPPEAAVLGNRPTHALKLCCVCGSEGLLSYATAASQRRLRP
jgi:hypothetical protein